MSNESKRDSLALTIAVNTSGLEKAIQAMDRLVAAAEAARVAGANLSIPLAMISAADFVETELVPDETPSLILAELRALRAELKAEREAKKVTIAEFIS